MTKIFGWLVSAAERNYRARQLNAYADAVERESGPLTDDELAQAEAWLTAAASKS